MDQTQTQNQLIGLGKPHVHIPQPMQAFVKSLRV